MNVHDLLKAKDLEHGRVENVSHTFCSLCDVFYSSRNYATMTEVERMSTLMILMKLSRAMSGGRVKDHWTDMGGYAQLVINEIEASEAVDGGYGEQGL